MTQTVMTNKVAFTQEKQRNKFVVSACDFDGIEQQVLAEFSGPMSGTLAEEFAKALLNVVSTFEKRVAVLNAQQSTSAPKSAKRTAARKPATSKPQKIRPVVEVPEPTEPVVMPSTSQKTFKTIKA